MSVIRKIQGLHVAGVGLLALAAFVVVQFVRAHPDAHPSVVPQSVASAPVAALTGCPQAAPVVGRPPKVDAPAHPDRQAGEPLTRFPDPHAKVQPTYSVVLNQAVMCNIAAIAEEADRVGLPPVLVLSLGVQEGSLNCPPDCSRVGDLNLDPNGSIGTFQIFCVVHPSPTGDCRYWENPVNAMREMQSRWVSAFNSLGGWDAWQADVYSFLAAWAPRAQGSIGWSAALARANYAEGNKAYILGYLIPRTKEAPPPVVITVQGGGDWQAVRAIADTLDELSIRTAIQAIELRRAAGAAK